MRNRDTRFLHAAARVACLEARLLGKDELYRAAEADTMENAFRMLSERGVFGDRPPEQYEEALEESAARTYELVENITDGIGLTDIFRYPLDGHNLKVMIKEKRAGDFSELYKAGGTIPPEMMKRELAAERFFAVPERLGRAGLEAAEQLAKTGRPQLVDITVDKAVIALMAERAEGIGCAALAEYVRLKTDLINLQTTLRFLRIDADTYTAARAFAEGGSFGINELEAAYAAGYDGLKVLFRKISLNEIPLETVNTERNRQQAGAVVNTERNIGYAGTSANTEQNRRYAETAVNTGQNREHVGTAANTKQDREQIGALGAFEKEAQRCLERLVSRMRTVPFGIEPIIRFLYLKEREIRACRLVMAFKLFDLPEERVKARLGYIYAE